MKLERPTKAKADVVLTYVTESPSWKPSYRVVVGPKGKVMLQGWAIVDNTSGEEWKGVRVGVGSSSALSFRYDLWSVRDVQRQTLRGEERFVTAPPTGMSPYKQGQQPMVATLDDGEIERPRDHPDNVANMEAEDSWGDDDGTGTTLGTTTPRGGGGGRGAHTKAGGIKPQRAQDPRHKPADSSRWSSGNAKLKQLAEQLRK